MLKNQSYRVFCAALFATLLTFGDRSVAGEQDAYIPADTLFYLGTGNPVPVENVFALVPDFASIRENPTSARLREMGGLLDDPVAGLATWGIEGKVSFSAYTVGFLPVLRVSLSDSDKFTEALKALEQKENLVSEEREQDGWAIRIYSSEELSNSDAVAAEQGDSAGSSGVDGGSSSVESEDDSTVSAGSSEAEPAADSDPSVDSDTGGGVESGEENPVLIVGVSDNDAVFGIVSGADNHESIRSVLGIVKPEQSIETNDKLRKLRRNWGYGDEVAAFVDFEQIAAVITDDANPVGQELQRSSFLDSRTRSYLEQMRAEPCRAELTRLVSNWPMLVAGYRKFEVDETQVDFDSHAAVVIGHEKLKETLKLFRGLLPASQSSSEPMLSLGLGLTVDNLAQALGQLNEMAASVQYSCQPLFPLNSLAASDLSAVSMGVVMFGGMARGVRGMSVNVFDADINPEDRYSAVKSIDSAIAISADDPAMLVGTLKMLPQLGALGDLPLDGSEIDVTSAFPLPLPEGLEIKAAIKGNNIVLFSGEKSTDFANRLAQNEAEGFFQGRANTRLILEKLKSSMADIGDADSRERFSQIIDRYLQGELSYSLEFTDNGIEVVSKGRVDRRDPSTEAAK